MKNLFFTLLASLLCASAVAQKTTIEFVTTPDTASKSANYNSNRAPLAPAAFIKLPLGAITPEGWVGEMLKRQGDGLRATFTVRKVSFGVGVERTFPVHSPVIDKIEVVSKGDVRRAKLYFLRDRVGKAARIREKRI